MVLCKTIDKILHALPFQMKKHIFTREKLQSVPGLHFDAEIPTLFRLHLRFDPVQQKQPGLAQILLSCHNDMILLYEACTQIMFIWLKFYYNAL